MRKTATVLVAATLVLVTLGIVMLGSASSQQARTQYGDAWYYVKRQVLWLVLGLLVAAWMMRLDYATWRNGLLIFLLMALTTALLILVFVPGIGRAAKGAARWIHLGVVTLQPSEFAKLTIIVLLAGWMARVQRRTDELFAGLLVPVGCLTLILGLIFVEPDFGTTLLIAVVGLTTMFVGGARLGYLVVVSVLGLSCFVVGVMASPEHLRRVLTFLDPWEHAQDEAYQLVNAIYAFVVGGALGEGLGHGLQKEYYLPEAHTDFIFAIVGEELGLAATLATVLLFFVIFVCGLRISLRAPDDFGRLLGFGITLMLTLQAAINVGVVTGCLPTKGLALPFISYGGSSLIVSLAMVGILVNIALHAVPGGRLEAHAVKDRAHRL